MFAVKMKVITERKNPKIIAIVSKSINQDLSNLKKFKVNSEKLVDKLKNKISKSVNKIIFTKIAIKIYFQVHLFWKTYLKPKNTEPVENKIFCIFNYK